MNALIKQQMNYLRTTAFRKHKSGNYGMYGLNFLGAAPVIQMNGDIWKFLWFIPGKDDATFVNAKGTQYTFNVTITTANGSATSTATTTATPGGKPDKITSVTASPGSKLVTLTFPQPNTNGTPITSYTINAYYTDSTNAVKMETLTIPVTSSNYSISGNNVTITLYTKSNDAKFATGSVITNATPATTKTIFTSVQPYAHVPLVTYPVGYERMNKNKKDKSKYCLILCIILISIFILYLLNSKRR